MQLEGAMQWLLVGMAMASLAAAQPVVDRAQALNLRGNQLEAAGDYSSALPLYREATALWRAMGAEFEAHAAATMVNLGIALAGTGDRQAAVRVLDEALAINRRALGVTHLRTLANINKLAANCAVLGDLDRAESLYNEALPLERQLYPGDIQLARTLIGVANMLIRRGRPREAMAPADEALSLAIRIAGEESMEAALAYGNAAEVHRAMGNVDRALPLFRRARVLYSNALGADHPRVAAVLSQEGLMLMLDGKPGLAEQAMLQALASIEKRCPGCLVELSVAQSNLGILRLNQKRYREADKALTRSIELALKSASHPGSEVAGMLEALAIVKEKELQHAAAAKLNEHARAIRAYR
jgi:tetratricopeptide (TPR) repeat protein